MSIQQASIEIGALRELRESPMEALNGPLAAETRLWGRFLSVMLCVAVCHCESMCCGAHGRIADGVRAMRTVGAHRRLFHGRPRTGRADGVFRA
jgi:hypothetical protein